MHTPNKKCLKSKLRKKNVKNGSLTFSAIFGKTRCILYVIVGQRESKITHTHSGESYI